jgi:hypothetical protein
MKAIPCAGCLTERLCKCCAARARKLRRLRALADGYRRKAEEALYPAMYCERCETFITTEDTILGVCQVHKTLPLEGFAAKRMARVHAARDAAAQERARIVAACQNCARAFWVQRHVKVTYSTRKP